MYRFKRHPTSSIESCRFNFFILCVEFLSRWSSAFSTLGNILWDMLFDWVLGFVQAIVRERRWTFWGEGNGMNRTTEEGDAEESRKLSFGFAFGGEAVIIEEVWVIRLMGT